MKANQVSSPKSEELFKESLKHVPGGVHSPVRAFRGVGGTPRFIESAKGSRIRDVDGNEYLDFCMSWGPLLFGHQDPEIREAVIRAIDRGWSYGTAEPYSLELAEMITRSIPWVEKIRFVNSGTEAVMSALRIARAVTGRNKILKFEGCYHGHVDSMLVKAGSGLADAPSPDSAGVPQSVAEETIVVPLDRVELLREAFERYGKEIAAAIVEPIPANNGLLLQKSEFLFELEKCVRKSGSLLIFDEVITGFRVAFGGMAEKTGIRPDLVTYGKIIGGGFPVGAFGGRKEWMDWVAPSGPVYQAGTLSGNPVAMQAGIAMMKKIKRENPYPLLEKRTEFLANGLEEVSKKYDGFFSKVQRASSLLWPVFGEISTKDGVVRSVNQIPEMQRDFFKRLFHKLLEQRIYVAPSAFEVCFLSTTHQENELDEFINGFDQALRITLKERIES